MKQIKGLSASIKKLDRENTRLTKCYEAIEEDNKRLKKGEAECGRRLDDLEAYSRADNLIIRGLPESSAAERATAAPSLTNSDSGPTLHENYESGQRFCFCHRFCEHTGSSSSPSGYFGCSQNKGQISPDHCPICQSERTKFPVQRKKISQGLKSTDFHIREPD